MPNITALENYQMFDLNNDKDGYNILKKTDLSADFQNNADINLSKICLSISSIDIQVTNRQIKELKNFNDNFKKYHEQIALEVLRDLQQIQMINFSIQQFEREYNRIVKATDSEESEEEKFHDLDLPKMKLLKKFSSQKSFLSRKRSVSGHSSENDNNFKSVNSKDFKDAADAGASSRGDDDDDEFFDA